MLKWRIFETCTGPWTMHTQGLTWSNIACGLFLCFGGFFRENVLSVLELILGSIPSVGVRIHFFRLEDIQLLLKDSQGSKLGCLQHTKCLFVFAEVGFCSSDSCHC